MHENTPYFSFSPFLKSLGGFFPPCPYGAAPASLDFRYKASNSYDLGLESRYETPLSTDTKKYQ